MNVVKAGQVKKIIIILGFTLFANILLGEEKPTSPAEAEKPNAPKPAKDEVKSISLPVPTWLGGSGYILYVDGKEWDLSKQALVVNPTLDQVPVELFDAGNRLVDFKKTYIDQDLLEEVRNRKFAGALDFAFIQATNRKGWQDLFLTGSRFSLGLEFNWRWSNLLMINRLRFLTEGGRTKQDVAANYGAAEFAAGVGFVIAPFRRAHGYFRKVSFWPAAGVLFARHAVAIGDGVVSRTDSDYSIGGWGELMTKLPIANNFSGQIGVEVSRQKIEFKKFDVVIDSMDFGLLFGGNYAF